MKISDIRERALTVAAWARVGAKGAYLVGASTYDAVMEEPRGKVARALSLAKKGLIEGAVVAISVYDKGQSIREKLQRVIGK